MTGRNMESKETSMTQTSSVPTEMRTLLSQVERLSAEVRELRHQGTRRPRFGSPVARWVAVVSASASVMLLAAAATSQSDECSSMLPFCFASGTPARATEVNQNFATLADAVTDVQDELALSVDQDVDGNVSILGQLDVGMYEKSCTEELAADTDISTTDCNCADGEVALSGGAWAAGVGSVRESRPRGLGWRVGCVDAAGTAVLCAGFVIRCARIVNVTP